mmetsp:Transcript_7233/g.26614  ORF Transcript_7233/g.26614 Transcript_7233/m.26614 type:complete len:214 (-) Transcript_7233:223-864(-)
MASSVVSLEVALSHQGRHKDNHKDQPLHIRNRACTGQRPVHSHHRRGQHHQRVLQGMARSLPKGSSVCASKTPRHGPPASSHRRRRSHLHRASIGTGLLRLRKPRCRQRGSCHHHKPTVGRRHLAKPPRECPSMLICFRRSVRPPRMPHQQLWSRRRSSSRLGSEGKVPLRPPRRRLLPLSRPPHRPVGALQARPHTNKSGRLQGSSKAPCGR